MTPYSLLVFFHVLGAVGMFTAWGVEAVAISQLASGTQVGAQGAIALRRKIVPMAMASMLTAIATGIWMLIVRWGHQPWAMAAMAALVAIAALGIAFDRKAKPRLAAALAERADALHALHLTSGALALSLRLRVTLGIAILALMVGKPDVSSSMTILGLAAAVCLTLVTGAVRRRGLASRHA